MPPLLLSETQLNQIAEALYILRDPTETQLLTPASSGGAGSLAPAMTIADLPQTHPNVGLGVVYFPNSAAPGAPPKYEFGSPRIWLHNPGKVYRIGSTTKIVILLAAAQLRQDVRAVQNLGILHSPEEYDELFAMKALWKRGKDSETRKVVANARPPRISTMFNFPAGGFAADFWGPSARTPDGNTILAKLSPDEHLSWARAKEFEFSERLWLAGALSDNVAATSCISEMGLGYIRAVQYAYGLCRSKPTTMRLLLGGGYTGMRANSKVRSASALTYRSLGRLELQHAEDFYRDPIHGDHASWVASSAAALTAFMIALFQDRLVPTTAHPFSGADACGIIRANLADGSGLTTRSILAEGVGTATTITKQVTKIGLLERIAGDFAYVETLDPVVAGDRRMAYGMVGTNLRDDGVMGLDIGSKIHAALRTV